MSFQQKPGQIDDKTSARDVEQYLRRHPDFFEHNTNLLTELKVPHVTGSAVSLVERQVGVLRAQNNKLTKQLEELIKIARENDKLSKQVFHMMLALMSAKELGRVFALLQETLRRDFNADAVTVRLLAIPKKREYLERSEFVSSVSAASEIRRQFDKYLKDGRPVCGRLKPEQNALLFGDKAERVKSMAFIPLTSGASFGVLAIGSFDEQRFQSGMGTMYLSQMSELISKSLLQFMDPA